MVEDRKREVVKEGSKVLCPAEDQAAQSHVPKTNIGTKLRFFHDLWM